MNVRLATTSPEAASTKKRVPSSIDTRQVATGWRSSIGGASALVRVTERIFDSPE